MGLPSFSLFVSPLVLLSSPSDSFEEGPKLKESVPCFALERTFDLGAEKDCSNGFGSKSKSERF